MQLSRKVWKKVIEFGVRCILRTVGMLLIHTFINIVTLFIWNHLVCNLIPTYIPTKATIYISHITIKNHRSNQDAAVYCICFLIFKHPLNRSCGIDVFGGHFGIHYPSWRLSMHGCRSATLAWFTVGRTSRGERWDGVTEKTTHGELLDGPWPTDKICSLQSSLLS